MQHLPKNRHLPNHHLRNIGVLFIYITCLVGCDTVSVQNKDEYFKDYNFNNKVGIEKTDIETLTKSKTPFVKLVPNQGAIDSIYLLNFSKRHPVMPVRLYTRNDITVYEVNYQDIKYGPMKRWFIFEPSSNYAMEFNFFTPIINVDSSMNCYLAYYDDKKNPFIIEGRIKQKDTVNFIDRLLKK